MAGYGDELQAVREGEQIAVVVKRACESLGIQAHGQQEKLQTKPWATTQLICVVAPDGKEREMFCLDLDSLPMWLATRKLDKRRDIFTRRRGAVDSRATSPGREASTVTRGGPQVNRDSRAEI
ncbi:MAG: phage antirepressor N-terminal domain-containing protein [Polyangiaceae bacterium]